MDALEALHARIDDFAKAGRTASWGGETRLTASCAKLAAAAQTLRGLYRSTTNSVVLSKFSCGSDDGLALVVIEGNYKDEATLVASAAVTTAFLDELEAPLVAEADVPPLLRRAVLEAHDRVRGLAHMPVVAGHFGTVGGPRTSLRGIGASLAAALVLPHRAWFTWVGECPIWLLRDGRVRRLSLPHTLANDPGYRAAVQHDSGAAFPYADSVVMKVLGLTDEPPGFDVTRLDLRPADRIVLGNEWLTDHIEPAARTAHGRSASGLCQELVSAIEAEPAPIPVTVGVAAIL